MAELDQASKAEVDSKAKLANLVQSSSVCKEILFTNSYCSVIVFGCSEIVEIRALLIYMHVF